MRCLGSEVEDDLEVANLSNYWQTLTTLVNKEVTYPSWKYIQCLLRPS